MPSVSEAQHKAMEAAAHGHSTLGIPESVGKEFVAADEFYAGVRKDMADYFEDCRADAEGEEWKTVNGAHILVKGGEVIGGAGGALNGKKEAPTSGHASEKKKIAPSELKKKLESTSHEKLLAALKNPQVDEKVKKHIEQELDERGVRGTTKGVSEPSETAENPKEPETKKTEGNEDLYAKARQALSGSAISKNLTRQQQEGKSNESRAFSRLGPDMPGFKIPAKPRADNEEFNFADAEIENVRSDSESKQCAGILFRAPGPLYLLVNRTDNGVWEQPGGHIEAGETAEQAAVRECIEEIGTCPDGQRVILRNSGSDGMVYTCFLQNVGAPFKVKLNHENIASIWTDGKSLPGIHAEVAQTISLLSGNELDIAKHIQAGDLQSPQQYENIWLFDVRITGTGTSYRSALDEYVYRPPENFLSDEFVERCNGLPLIFEHPDKSILNTEEYRERAIGTVILPYIKGDEVWGIAKVYDDDAAMLMATTHISTSPAVVFRDAGSTETIELDGGKSVLIEGKPSYLDHLAICEAGVWDKGGEPNGINLGDIEMAEEKVPAWADALVKRMDAIEAKGATPPEDMKVDKARKDADEAEAKKAEAEKSDKARKDEGVKEGEEEEKKLEAEKADKARKDAEEDKKKEEEKMDAQSKENEALRKQIEDMTARINAVTAPLSNADRDALSTAQARADSVAQMFGDTVTAPLHNENPVAYRKRLAAKFQKHSTEFKDVKLDSLEGPSFDIVESKIYADAQTVAMNPSEGTAGRLIPMVRTDSAGRKITTFTGDPLAWMGTFMSPGAISTINRNQKGA